MKKIFNTLQTAKQIQSFLTDSGTITVVYTYLNNNADFHAHTNVKTITCEFYGVVTEMNKIFLNSLYTVATPLEVDVTYEGIEVKFDLRETKDSFENTINENKILLELQKMTTNALKDVEYYENAIEATRADIIIFDEFANYFRFTNKRIETIRKNTELLEALEIKHCIITDVNTNDEIRRLVKDELKYMDITYKHYHSIDDALEYYTRKYTESMLYIS